MREKAITLILTLIAVLAPLLIIPDSDNYNILKLIVLLTLGTALLIMLLINYKTISYDKKDIIILIFLDLIIISTIFSSDIAKSIIGEDNRFEGLLVYIVYICIYIGGKKYFNYKQATTFLNIMFYVSMVIGTLGILQRTIDCIDLYPIFNKHICSTFGNSNFFGSFISIILPISISCYVLYGNKKGFLLSVIMFFNMISSGTRSAWVAFFVIGLMGIVFLIKQKNRLYFKRAIILILVFIIIFIYLLNGFELGNNSILKTRLAQMQRELEMLTKLGISNQMGSGRIEIWKMTLKLIIQNPIVGCGVDNLKNGLIEDCTEEFVEFALRTSAVVDKAHNEYLHVAATIGVPALIVYLIFIILILSPIVKLALKDKISFAISITIISYLVQAFFNISTIGVAPIFWLLLGISDNKEFIDKLKQ